MTDKELWFKNQCEAEGILAEDIKAFGEYATNKDGDFLYSVEHKDGLLTMNSISASNLAERKDDYPQWLLSTMLDLEENYQGEYGFIPRGREDALAISVCFKEALCRNEALDKQWREELRMKPTCGIYLPYRKEVRNKVFLGLRDVDAQLKDRYPSYVTVPEEITRMGGYRFALKIIDLEELIEVNSCRQWKGQHGPFRILADMEEELTQMWEKEGKIQEEIWVDNSDEGCSPGHGADIDGVAFSHFEVENEPDENYRVIFAVYSWNHVR